MGAVGGLLGLGGGAGGTGFAVNNGTSQGQIQNAYTGTQNSMQAQQQLLNAIQGQHGLQNQSDVYNQFQNVAAGQGPNPAQAMLNQATGANVANQAALMAGQRGAGANVGLMARQNAMQGANLQQQAAGQQATMQANQSMNAIGEAGKLANNMAGNQIGQTNANVNAQQAEQQNLLGANTAQNNVNGQLANTTMQGQQGALAGLMGGAGIGGKLIGGLFKADGGLIEGSAFSPQSMFGQFANAPVEQNVPTFSSDNPGAKALSEMGKQEKPVDPKAAALNEFHQMVQPGGKSMLPAQNGNPYMPMAASGGKVPAMVSPGEKFLKPEEAKAVAQGKADPMQVGETIPGKAKVKGDSLKNDVVPKKLEVGGIVLPRSVMSSKNPGADAKKFVDAYMSKKGKRA